MVSPTIVDSSPSSSRPDIADPSEPGRCRAFVVGDDDQRAGGDPWPSPPAVGVVDQVAQDLGCVERRQGEFALEAAAAARVGTKAGSRIAAAARSAPVSVTSIHSIASTCIRMSCCASWNATLDMLSAP